VGSDEKTGRQPVQQPVTDEAIFKVAKEIVVKFIEVGRISPANFAEHFSEIYGEILTTVSGGAICEAGAPEKKKNKGE
jgi:hypothetical protein